MRQILEGRHIYRGIEAHTITALAVYTLLMQVLLKGEEKNEIDVQIKEVGLAYQSYTDQKQMRLQMLLNPRLLSYTGD